MLKKFGVPTTCNGCAADTWLPASDIRVIVDTDKEQGTYSFTCKCCGTVAVKAATSTVLGLLEAQGVSEISEIPEGDFIDPQATTDAPDLDATLDEIQILSTMNSDQIWAALEAN